LSDREELGRRAVKAALRLRGGAGRPLHVPLCPIDLALDLGVEVRFEALHSLEGLYSPDGPLVVLGSLRPRGRRAFTCAHELGHHVFGHGLSIDELQDEPAPRHENEVLADRFAAALLMPKLAVLNSFAARKWDVASCTPEQVFVVAGVLGVGYTTLIGYLEGTLHAVEQSHAVRLKRVTPKSIRSRMLGWEPPAGLVVVDEFWTGRPVDLGVGDVLLAPPGATVEGSALERVDGRVLRARMSGVAWLRAGGWTAEVRSMRADFTGLAEYRHLEALDDDV
jgi:hypothetical protein